MYKLTKRIEVAGSHQLDLDYESPCHFMHGHNWIINITVEGHHLNQNGMLIDFKHIKNVVNQLDHTHINDVVKVNPTAENMAHWIANKVQDEIDKAWKDEYALSHAPSVTEVSVQESEGNVACFIL